MQTPTLNLNHGKEAICLGRKRVCTARGVPSYSREALCSCGQQPALRTPQGTCRGFGGLAPPACSGPPLAPPAGCSERDRGPAETSPRRRLTGVTGERPRPAPGLSATGTAAGGAWAHPAHSPCGEAGCSFGGRGGPGSGERKSGPHHTFMWTSCFTIWGPSYLQKEIWLNYSPYLTQWFRRL